MTEKASLAGLSDEELMHLYQNGNSQAFDALYKRHAPRVYGYLRARTSSRAHSDDLLQRCFFKLHQSRHHYQPSRPFLPWMWSILRSTVLDFYRLESRRSHHEKELQENIPLSLADPEKTGSLSEILKDLPIHDQTLLKLRSESELSFEEIGTKLGITAANARQKFSRLVKRLKEKLGSRS